VVAYITLSAVVDRSAPWQAIPPGGTRGQSGAQDRSELAARRGVAAGLLPRRCSGGHGRLNARRNVVM
jgi:hypothetical protein